MKLVDAGASSRDDASSGRNVDGSSPSGPPQTGELPESSSGLGCHYPKMVAVLKHRSSPIQGSGENECEFHILGTAHVSSESCNDVRKVIRKVKPDVSPMSFHVVSFTVALHRKKTNLSYNTGRSQTMDQ